MVSCWHARWGLPCDASDADVRATVKDTFTLFKRDIEQNKEQVRQLGLDYQLYVEKKHPKCCNGCVVTSQGEENIASSTASMIAPPSPPSERAVEQSSVPPRKRRKGRTAASTLVNVRAIPVDGGGGEENTAVMTVVPRTIFTENDGFRDVDLSSEAPDVVIQPVRTNSFYKSLHANDYHAFPLSSLSFHNRRELYDYGLVNVHNNDASVWGFNKIQVRWYGRDATTNQRFICALIINEMHEPRFGHFFCPSHDIVELDTAPVPCFMNCNGYGCIRYCGTWTFQRVRDTNEGFLYVNNSRPRICVYRMTLSSYDDRWGTNAQM